MAKIKDLKGNKFNKLTALGFIYINKSGYAVWSFICDCGTTKNLVGTEVSNGKTKSCGCLSYGKTNLIRHGQRKNGVVTSEYEAWSSMMARCNNPKHKKYNDYGGRGIMVCERWRKFENFFEDMGKKPSPELSLDRFPNNETGNYEKSNCRWATRIEQNRNRRSNRWIEFNGEIKIITQWAKMFETRKGNLIGYLKKHSFEEAYSFYMNKKIKQLQRNI